MKRKTVSVILVFVLVLATTCVMPSSAVTDANDTTTPDMLDSAKSINSGITPELTPAVSDEEIAAADRLNELGLFSGIGDNADGTPNYDLGRAPTRMEAITLLVRLLGKEAEAQAGSWTIPFTDVDDWAKPYVGYAYTNGLTSGTSATNFRGNDTVSTAQYLTFLLRALGYDSNSDFAWDAAWELTDELGITNGEYSADTAFTRGNAVLISANALDKNLKDGSKTLLEAIEEALANAPEIPAPAVYDYNPVGFTVDEKPSAWLEVSPVTGKKYDAVYDVPYFRFSTGYTTTWGIGGYTDNGFIVDGKYLVPVQSVFELAGWTLDWSDATQTVTVTKDGQSFSMTVGSNKAVVNGETITMETEALIVGWRIDENEVFSGKNEVFNGTMRDPTVADLSILGYGAGTASDGTVWTEAEIVQSMLERRVKVLTMVDGSKIQVNISMLHLPVSALKSLGWEVRKSSVVSDMETVYMSIKSTVNPIPTLTAKEIEEIPEGAIYKDIGREDVLGRVVFDGVSVWMGETKESVVSKLGESDDVIGRFSIKTQTPTANYYISENGSCLLICSFADNGRVKRMSLNGASGKYMGFDNSAPIEYSDCADTELQERNNIMGYEGTEVRKHISSLYDPITGAPDIVMNIIHRSIHPENENVRWALIIELGVSTGRGDWIQ